MLTLGHLHLGHGALGEEAFLYNLVEESGESPVIVVDGPRRCSARGGFRTVDLPLGEEPSIVGPAFPPAYQMKRLRMPDFLVQRHVLASRELRL